MKHTSVGCQLELHLVATWLKRERDIQVSLSVMNCGSPNILEMVYLLTSIKVS